MLQRLALARALLTRPSLLLLDEPFTGSIAAARSRSASSSAALRDGGAIVVVVTHDLEAIAERTDHVAILRRGQLVFEERGALLRTSSSRTSTTGTRTDMSVLRQAARVAWKDLRIELRSREIVYTMAFFGGADRRRSTRSRSRSSPTSCARRCPGMLWVAIAFAGTIGLGRAFDRERENDTMRALLLAPVPRLVGVPRQGDRDRGARCSSVALVCTPLLALFLDAPLFDDPLPLDPRARARRDRVRQRRLGVRGDAAQGAIARRAAAGRSSIRS